MFCTASTLVTVSSPAFRSISAPISTNHENQCLEAAEFAQGLTTESTWRAWACNIGAHRDRTHTPVACTRRAHAFDDCCALSTNGSAVRCILDICCDDKRSIVEKERAPYAEIAMLTRRTCMVNSLGCARLAHGQRALVCVPQRIPWSLHTRWIRCENRTSKRL